MLPEDVERNLVAQARNGDRRAFDGLVQRYRPRIVNFCLGILGQREEAEDAAQETCRRAWQSIGSFRGDAPIFTWLSSIALNACRNTLRARSSTLRSHTSSLDDPENRGLADQTDSGTSVEEQVLGPLEPLLERVMEKARGRWNKGDYDLFLLRYGKGMTYEEIAEILDVPASTLRSRHRDHIQPVLDAVKRELLETGDR